MRTKEIKAMIQEGLFKAGAVLSRADVQKLTKRARPTAVFRRNSPKLQIASNLLLVDFAANVNRQLHDKGLHLRSQNYYTEFRVLPRKETVAVVESYFNRAENAFESGEALTVGRAKRR